MINLEVLNVIIKTDLKPANHPEMGNVLCHDRLDIELLDANPPAVEELLPKVTQEILECKPANKDSNPDSRIPRV